MNRAQRLRTRLIVGLCVSAAALLLAVKNVQWEVFLDSFRRARKIYVLYATVMVSANFIARARRWQMLLRPVKRISWMGDSLRFYMIGMMVNMLLPFKAGELARAYLLGAKCRLGKMLVFSSVVVERLADVIFLAVSFLFVAFVGPKAVSDDVARGILAVGALAAISALILKLLSRYHDRIRLESLKTFQAGGAGRRVLSSFEKIGLYLKAEVLLSAFFTTAAVWLFNYYSVAFYMKAFNLDFAWHVPVVVLVVSNFGMIIPSSPGAIGLAHFLYVYSLALFGVEKSEALAVAITIHTVGYVLIVVAGALSLWIEGLTFAQLREKRVEMSLEG